MSRKLSIPPQPERMPTRGMRMRRLEELPVPAQNEIRARRGELPEEHPEKRRTSLLQRLGRGPAWAVASRSRKRSRFQSAGGAEHAPAAGRRTAAGTPPRTANSFAAARVAAGDAAGVAASNHGRNRYPSMPSAARLRVSTTTAGRRLCITGARKTNSTFRPSCAGRRINAAHRGMLI